MTTPAEENNNIEEEDDWNPLPPKKENSILNKLKVKFTNEEIQRQGNEQYKDVKFDQGDFNDGDLSDGDEDYHKQDEGEFFDEEGNEPDKDNKLFYNNKEAIKKLREQIVSEDVFFNPIEDETNAKWVNDHLNRGKNGDGSTVLSCPCCFIQLCYDSQRHSFYDGQYRAMSVQNVKVNSGKLIEPIIEGDGKEKEKKQGFKKKQNNKGRNQKNSKTQQQSGKKEEGTFQIAADEDLSKASLKDLEKKLEDQKDKFLLYFSVECASCGTEVAAYELNEKVYHFFNVIPSL